MTPDGPANGLRRRDRRSLARVLSWIEAGDPRGRDAVEQGVKPSVMPNVVGITGAPGAGKSTLTNALLDLLRADGDTVAALAVDPSSPVTGGAILGDRIRMSGHLHDDGVFIRSMASRGALGGLAAAVPLALRALAIFGFDWLLVETVGVGQLEVDIAVQADTTLVVMNPGWGDDVQASKAGLLEIADVFVVNKADRDGVRETVREITAVLDLNHRDWRPPVVTCVASTGLGVPEVWSAVSGHLAYAAASGLTDARGVAARVLAFEAAVRELAVRRAEDRLREARGMAFEAAVVAGDIEPWAAATALFASDTGLALD